MKRFKRVLVSSSLLLAFIAGAVFVAPPASASYPGKVFWNEPNACLPSGGAHDGYPSCSVQAVNGYAPAHYPALHLDGGSIPINTWIYAEADGIGQVTHSSLWCGMFIMIGNYYGVPFAKIQAGSLRGNGCETNNTFISVEYNHYWTQYGGYSPVFSNGCNWAWNQNFPFVCALAGGTDPQSRLDHNPIPGQQEGVIGCNLFVELGNLVDPSDIWSAWYSF